MVLSSTANLGQKYTNHVCVLFIFIIAALGMVVEADVTSDRDERMICYIVNTAEYCHKTSVELAENVSKIIDPQFADKVDMSEVQVTIVSIAFCSL
ncbi:hypothetical protein COCNU_scaffold012629G000020 [Cocos nucifera]|nr:hypothetical protein [Cocos nucifera]